MTPLLFVLLLFVTTDSQQPTTTEQRMLTAVNHYRTQRKLEPLTINPILQRVARDRVRVFNHHANGRWSWEQAHGEGFRGAVTDNLCQGAETPEESVSGWAHSSVGHAEQMKGYRKLNGQWVNEHFDCCGVAHSGKNYILVLGHAAN